MRHDIPTPHNRGQWETTANHLAQCRNIGGNAIIFLRPAIGKAEARHNFVKDQHNAIAITFLTQQLKKTWRRWNNALQRFHDNCRNIVAEFREQ